jgi:hypothetical protein
MKKIIVFLGTAGLSIVLSSCATLTRGTKEALEIKQNRLEQSLKFYQQAKCVKHLVH